MTATELDALEAAAKAATPGPWTASDYMDDGGRGILDAENGFVVRRHAPGKFSAADFTYIAAASPDVVLRLVAALREMESCNEAAGAIERIAAERDALAPDATRWRSLWACERIRVIGGASLGTPDALLGLDFHRKHPARDDAESRAMLLAFVDDNKPGEHRRIRLSSTIVVE